MPVSYDMASNHISNMMNNCGKILTARAVSNRLQRSGGDFGYDNLDELQPILLVPYWTLVFPWHKMKDSPTNDPLILTGKALYGCLQYDYYQIQDEATRTNPNSKVYRILVSLFMIDGELKNYSDVFLSNRAIDFLNVTLMFRGELQPTFVHHKNLLKEFILLQNAFERNIGAAFVLNSMLGPNDNANICPVFRRNFNYFLN